MSFPDLAALPDLGPQPLLGYTHEALERAAERRSDPTALAALLAAPESGVYVLAGEFVLLHGDAGAYDPLFTGAQAHALGAAGPAGAAGDTIFLGLAHGAPRFAMGLDPAALATVKGQPGIEVMDLRSIAVQGVVAASHLAALAEAKALLHWHVRHRFCANCGAPSAVSDGGWRRDCPQCKTPHFPRTDPVVIMLALAGDRCLLGRQSRFAAGMWSCLAGFVEPGETIEHAVRRETREEAGIACGRVLYFASQPWPFPMSLMIGCHAQALSQDIVVDRTELEDARWFTRAEVAAMLLRRHPDGLTTPPPVAIAYHIIRAFVENGDRVLA